MLRVASCALWLEVVSCIPDSRLYNSERWTGRDEGS